MLSPAMVLRTILCASPTAEQIEAALAANGFKIVSVKPPSPEEVYDPLALVQEIIERRSISASKLALNVGISPSTLNRALNNPNHKFMLSTRTLQKIKEWDHAQPERVDQA